MTKTTAALLASFTFAAAGSGQAQTSSQKPIRFVGVHVGAQTNERTLSTSTSTPLYQENLIINTNHHIGNGAIYGLSGGYQVLKSDQFWKNLVIGVEFDVFNSRGDAQVAASVPNPLFFNQPVAVNLTVPGLKRQELGTHLSAMWFIPIKDDIDVAVYVGPSFIHVSQDLAATGTVASNTQNLAIATTKESGTAVGVNVGFEGTYMFSPRYGASLFLRYAGGSADLTNAPDAAAGGFQIGVGGRYRF